MFRRLSWLPVCLLLALGGGCRTNGDRDASLVATDARFQMVRGAICRGPVDSKRIALVFTGHEYAEGGAAILDALKARGLKASFFFTGDFLDNPKFTGWVRRVVREGHYLGPHSNKHLLYCSWDSSRRTLVSRDQFDSDLARNVRKVERFAGKRPKYYLPPYEHYNEEIAAWSRAAGMHLVNFTSGTRSNADYTGEADRNFVSSQVIFESILTREREDAFGLNGYLLLLHAGAGPGRTDKFHTHLGQLLDSLLAKGYEFVRVDTLLGADSRPR